jgi:DNA invertase Pin-like site-specific DNA recombinase
MPKTPKTKQPSRMDAYVRVSRVGGRAGESFISPTQQRAQIEGWAKLRGVEIVAEHEDLDQSGGKLDRPGLEALLARIETGETEGVIVAKLDRLSRLGVADALKLVERITDAGASIAAVDLGLDPTTPFGEFGMTIMLAMARMERRRSDSWEDAKERALDRGARMGPTPFGYERGDGGHLKIHPTDGPIAAEAFKRAADGIPAALDYLRAKAPDARTWTAFTVRRMLRNRSYLGETHYGPRLERESHPELVTRSTFDRANPGEEKPQRRAAAAFPLSGFATCAGCGEVLIGGRGGKSKDGHGLRTYRCRASLKSWKGAKCPAPTNIVAERLERYLVERVKAGMAGKPREAEGVKDAGSAFVDAPGELDAAEAARERFAVDTEAHDLLGEKAWRAGLHAHNERVERAEAACRELTTREHRHETVVPVDLLDSLTPEELTPVLHDAFESVRVAKGRGGPLDRRVRVVLHGEAPTGVAAL